MSSPLFVKCVHVFALLLVCQRWSKSVVAQVILADNTVPHYLQARGGCWTRKTPGECHDALQFLDGTGSAEIFQSSCEVGEHFERSKISQISCYCPSVSTFCDVQTMLMCRAGEVLFTDTQNGLAQCAYFSEHHGLLRWWQLSQQEAASLSQQAPVASAGVGTASSHIEGPLEPVKADELWDWCDCGTGKNFVNVWPSGDRTRAVQVNSSDWRRLVFDEHISSISWQCDGMDEPQTSYFATPTRFVRLERTVEEKTFCWLDGQHSGRLHWTAEREAARLIARHSPTRLVNGEEVRDWCDCGTGVAGQLLWVWPTGAPMEKVAVADGHLVAFQRPTSEIEWVCDGMRRPQKTTFSSPMRVWRIQRSVRFKVLCGGDSGRITWQGFQEDVFQDAATPACPRLDTVLNRLEREQAVYTEDPFSEEHCIATGYSERGYIAAVCLFLLLPWCCCVVAIFALRKNSKTPSDRGVEERTPLHMAPCGEDQMDDDGKVVPSVVDPKDRCVDSERFSLMPHEGAVRELVSMIDVHVE